MSTKTTAGLQRTYRWVKLRQRIILLAGLIWFFTSLFLVSDSVDDSFGLVLLFLTEVLAYMPDAVEKYQSSSLGGDYTAMAQAIAALRPLVST